MPEKQYCRSITFTRVEGPQQVSTRPGVPRGLDWDEVGWVET